MNQTVTVEFITFPDATVVVVPPASRLKTFELFLSRAERDGQENSPEIEQARQLAQAIQVRIEQLAKVPEAHRSRMQFTFRPFTYGEWLEAERVATAVDENGPKRDDALARRHRLMNSFSLSGSELDALPVPIVDALSEELDVRTRPSPARLDFLLSQLISSDAATP
jgi:transcriptional regulator with XRE-family HTH domain